MNYRKECRSVPLVFPIKAPTNTNVGGRWQELRGMRDAGVKATPNSKLSLLSHKLFPLSPPSPHP
ncbi:hypothetical protein [Stenomitos frigidus]|uniref:hypothetical protein n=1 Tax=Stenomitos frigidus TaxID=1886765 RepID=UPI0011B20B75|nr:hypothetical protein [Stenomitos frigidus]